MNITIAAAAAALAMAPVTYGAEINTALRQGNEWEQVATPRKAYEIYTGPTAVITDILQGFQCDFTPKGTLTFDGIENSLDHIKGDMEITCTDLETFFQSWKAEWYEMNKPPKEWAFNRWVWEKVIIPKIIEEQNNNYFNGVKAVIVPGTPSTSVGSMDGLKKHIADYITAGKLVPIVTGVISAANIVSKVELMQASLPATLQKVGGRFIMSQTMANWYYADYRTKFGTGNGVIGNSNDGLMVDNSTKKVVGMASMEGSQRIIFSPDLIWGSRIGDAYLPAPVFVEDVRKIKMYFSYHRFIGFDNLLKTFVNDQV